VFEFAFDLQGWLLQMQAGQLHQILSLCQVIKQVPVGLPQQQLLQ
jgi:hypothetical protein